MEKHENPKSRSGSHEGRLRKDNSDGPKEPPMMGAKSGSPLGITKSHSTAPGWKLYKIMFTSHLEGDKNNKVIKSSYKIKVSRTVK